MESTVSEIHAYPLRPDGFCEPLFATPDSRRKVAEHLLEASWLSRACELRKRAGDCAHAREEPVELRRSPAGLEVTRRGARRCSWRKRRVVEVVARWRDVRCWWSDEEQRVNRLLFRVVVSGGEVVDLALDRSGAWTLVGVVD